MAKGPVFRLLLSDAEIMKGKKENIFEQVALVPFLSAYWSNYITMVR
jgi:hypothetical protein